MQEQQLICKIEMEHQVVFNCGHVCCKLCSDELRSTKKSSPFIGAVGSSPLDL